MRARFAPRLLVLLTACAASTPPLSPVLAGEEDLSSPLGDGDVPLLLDTSSMKRALRGALTSVATVPDATGWFDLELAGDDAPATRTLRVGTKARLPFTAGEVLDVRFAKRMVGFDAWNVDLELRDAQGALWAAVYTEMSDHDGWTLEPLPAAEGIPCRVAITHQGRRAVVPTGAWRRLETPDGAWAASAECPGPPPFSPGNPPVPIPDYSPDPTVVQVSRLLR